MKIFRALFPVAFAAAALLAIPLAQAQETLVLSTVNAVGTLHNRMGNHFRDQVATANVGVRVNHVEGEALGNAPQVMDQTIKGAIALMGTDMAWVTPFNKDLQVLNWSFAFRDRDHVGKFFDSDRYRKIVDDVAEKSGVRVLAAAPGQPRYLYSRTPVRSAGDLKGLKVRVPQIRTFVESWKAFGAVPTPLTFAEVFLGIKTGTIDAAFGAPSDTFGNNFHAAGTNVVRLADTFSSYAIVMNEARYRKLLPAQQKRLAELARESVQWASQEAQSELQALEARMAKDGATFSNVDTGPLRNVAAVAGRKLEDSGEWAPGFLQYLQTVR